jgi:hypothetical protein
MNGVSLTSMTSNAIFGPKVTTINLIGEAANNKPSLSGLSLNTFSLTTGLTLNVGNNRISGFTDSNTATGLKSLTYTNNYFSTNGWFSPSFPTGLTTLNINGRQNTDNIVFSSTTAYSGFSNTLSNLNIGNFRLSAASVNYITCWFANTSNNNLNGGIINFGDFYNISTTPLGNQKGDASSGGLNGIACRDLLIARGWTFIGTAAP